MKNNDKAFEGKVKKDVTAVMEDVRTGLGRAESKTIQTVTKAKDDLTTWVEGGVSQLSDDIEKLTGDARETVVQVAKTVNEDVKHGLSQYNAKAQEFADKVPGDLGAKAAKYPWVAISITLFVGFLLGSLLKPARRLLG